MDRKTIQPEFFFCFVFFSYGPFKNISHIEPTVHQRWAKTGEPRKKNTWPSVSRTWLSNMWQERGSNHSGEKPNGLRVSSFIHQATVARSAWVVFFVRDTSSRYDLAICEVSWIYSIRLRSYEPDTNARTDRGKTKCLPSFFQWRGHDKLYIS